MADVTAPLNRILEIDATSRLFPAHRELVPQLNELYELQLAFIESELLNDDDLIRNGAYFSRVGEVLTRHFLICSGEPVRLPRHSSTRLKSFFQRNQFRTGYATHGLFPYRGKFHPQMIKGLINAMGLRPGDTVLDPMMGSGTTLIEARLMGIKSIGIDASPFCCFMVNAKLGALTLPLGPVRLAVKDSRRVFEYFRSLAGQASPGSKTRSEAYQRDMSSFMENKGHYGLTYVRDELKLGEETSVDAFKFLLLAYLDSAGYSERSTRVAPYDQFRAILERYLFVAEKIQRVLEGAEKDLSPSEALIGDARTLPLATESVDGVVFSPPYSFAIDYVANDSFHLNYLGVDTVDLRKQMIGLRGKTMKDRFALYKEDMAQVLAECARVLRPRRICSIIVGTNNNQLSRVLALAPEQVPGIDEILIELGDQHGLRLVRKLSRQITGMANTMRTEYIVMLQRK